MVGLRDILYSVPPSLMIASILTVNNTCDRLNDIEAGRRTLSILLGERGSRFLIPAWGAAAYALSAALAATSGSGLRGLIPLGAGAIGSIPLYAALDRGAYAHDRKGPAMASILLIMVVFGLAMGASIALGMGHGTGAGD
jgi:1,4-dihydroxy-2-naphthoate octaprenyltransferase